MKSPWAAVTSSGVCSGHLALGGKKRTFPGVYYYQNVYIYFRRLWVLEPSLARRLLCPRKLEGVKAYRQRQVNFPRFLQNGMICLIETLDSDSLKIKMLINHRLQAGIRPSGQNVHVSYQCVGSIPTCDFWFQNSAKVDCQRQQLVAQVVESLALPWGLGLSLRTSQPLALAWLSLAFVGIWAVNQQRGMFSLFLLKLDKEILKHRLRFSTFIYLPLRIFC